MDSTKEMRRKMIRFVQIAGYVATTVVTERGMKQRLKVIEKWVEVANHSFKIQAYTSPKATCGTISMLIFIYIGPHINARDRVWPRLRCCASPQTDPAGEPVVHRCS